MMTQMILAFIPILLMNVLLLGSAILMGWLLRLGFHSIEWGTSILIGLLSVVAALHFTTRILSLPLPGAEIEEDEEDEDDIELQRPVYIMPPPPRPRRRQRTR